MKTGIVVTMLVLFLMGEDAFADVSGHKHGEHMTLQMKSQHHTMVVIDRQWAVVKKALKSGDVKSADKALQTILEKSSYIEKFKPHKNEDKRDQFLSEYRLFIENVTKLKLEIGKQDIASAATIMNAVQKSCDRCHIEFR